MVDRLLVHIKKIKNTFLTPRLFEFFINEKKYVNIINHPSKENFISKIFYKIFYFYPKLNEIHEWAQGNKKKYRNFADFANLELHDIFILNKILDLTKDKNSPILDLGCNQGRHIRYLHQRGLRNMHGVDIMQSAINYFKKNYYDIYKQHTIECNAFERYFKKIQDNFFHITYSFGATLELVHPSFDVIMHLVRVTNKYIVLYINEDGHWFPRYYIYEFKKNNAHLIFYKKKENLIQESVMIFEKK